jgi:hypothetical protein
MASPPAVIYLHLIPQNPIEVFEIIEAVLKMGEEHLLNQFITVNRQYIRKDRCHNLNKVSRLKCKKTGKTFKSCLFNYFTKGIYHVNQYRRTHLPRVTNSA